MDQLGDRIVSHIAGAHDSDGAEGDRDTRNFSGHEEGILAWQVALCFEADGRGK